MIDLALALAEDIQSYLTDDLCTVSRVGVTFGEPAAPVGENCREIWVWLSRVEDDAELGPGCAVRPRVTLSYRIYSCYDGDVTLESAQHEAAADCLIGLVNAVWCGLVQDKDSGVLMLVGDCDLITLRALVPDPPSGGAVSATGAVTVDYGCPPISA